MRPKPSLPLLLILSLTVLAVAWPAPARAQYGHGHGHGPTFVVGFGPGFYSPFFWPYGGWWYPYPAFAPYYYPWGYAYNFDADIRVQAKPTEAQVYVDGYYAGVVDDFDGTFQRLHVRPGGHEITLYLNGYRTLTQHIMVSTRNTYKLHAQMEQLAPGETAQPVPPPAARPAEPAPEYHGRRPPPPPEPYGVEPGRTAPPGERTMPPPERSGEASRFGTLAIRVQPADAEVTIDGEAWRGPEGQDRLTVQLASGSHRVEIHKSGYDPYSTEVQVRRGETTPLNVSLPRSRQ